MARVKGTAMADGNATEMAAVMVHGDRKNCPWQQQRRWAIAMATAMATLTATATVMATATESESEMVTAIAMEMVMARATIMKEGLPLHVAVMCSAFGWGTPCLHPMDIRKIHSPVLHHEDDTSKSVCSPSRGWVPDS